ncbi:MAG: hypothetical protein PQJ50_10310 [Spirochaetales bacterium]|nr:hypothetical protein [Spirochaetales bacterium]
MKCIPIILLFFLSAIVFAKENKDVWWSLGFEGVVYSFVREDLPETPQNESKPNGTLSLGLKTQRYSFKPDKKLGSWLSFSFRIPRKAIVEGEIGPFDALEGSMQVLADLNLGLGFRTINNSPISFYGGCGVHVYFSYLNAFTMMEVLSTNTETEILQYDLALGIGGELGMKIDFGRKLFMMTGTGLACDFYSYQDSRVDIPFNPPIVFKTKGSVPDYMALSLSPHISFGIQY